MTWPVTFESERFDLHTSGRITALDAERQTRTAEEILRRLARQPGLVLADEVGMGKTFVALTVAAAAALADRGRRPVVVMVPPSLQDKWPDDLSVFLGNCVCRAEDRRALTVRSAKSGLDFFRILDDPPECRARLVFVTHGAFHRNLTDPWVKFAILEYAMHGKHLGVRRAALPRFAPALVRAKAKYGKPELFERLAQKPINQWRVVISEYGEDPGDDPVPAAIVRVLDRGDADLGLLRDDLSALPARTSVHIEERLARTRHLLNDAIQDVWRRALRAARFRSPLLVLDEAHHLKNPATRLASLFVAEEAEEDARVLEGALEGGFERMLFLTATPFQLGHQELLNVLGRFAGISWDTLRESISREQFDEALEQLRRALNEAQLAAAELDRRWRMLTIDDARGAGLRDVDPDSWWRSVTRDPTSQPERIQVVWRAFERARDIRRAAEERLRPWVIRHVRDRCLPGTTEVRRVRLAGNGIRSLDEADVSGLPVSDGSLLPFLLAARAQAIVAHHARQGRDEAGGRATFAEGLASSYEAFLETRAPETQCTGATERVDEESLAGTGPDDPVLDRYLADLRRALPTSEAYAEHPKVSALVGRVVDLWTAGEKVVVFCHFRATGRALVRHLSAALGERIRGEAARRLARDPAEALERLRLFGEAFDEGRPLYRLLQQEMDGVVGTTKLDERERSAVFDVVRRFVRTPSFLARHLERHDNREQAFGVALVQPDASGSTLRDKLGTFVAFIADRCEERERAEYLAALERIHSGVRHDDEVEEESRGGRAVDLLPNVRLANGGVRAETRRRLLLGFNTPFFPEVLVASSVLAEGVDLHLNCRHLIHHDLAWNPSTIEQRTGRVDRIGAKAERVGQSIRVFLPYVAATQDEKMYRVVCDRERWFQVVMGEEYRTDEASTDRLESRLPFPAAAASELTFRLHVVPSGGEGSR